MAMPRATAASSMRAPSRCSATPAVAVCRVEQPSSARVFQRHAQGRQRPFRARTRGVGLHTQHREPRLESCAQSRQIIHERNIPIPVLHERGATFNPVAAIVINNVADMITKLRFLCLTALQMLDHLLCNIALKFAVLDAASIPDYVETELTAVRDQRR